MNRRNFLQILAAAAALPVFPKLKPVPGPRRLAYEGFIFIEDPNPLRFILTPISGPGDLVTHDLKAVTVEYLRETAGLPNPDWVPAEPPPGWRVNPDWEAARFEFDGYGLRDRFPERGPIPAKCEPA